MSRGQESLFLKANVRPHQADDLGKEVVVVERQKDQQLGDCQRLKFWHLDLRRPVSQPSSLLV